VGNLMIDSEARGIFRELFTMFPGIHNWLEKADDPEATYDTWRAMLARIDIGDAQAVLAALLAGDYDDYPDGTAPDRWPLWLIRKAKEFSGERRDRAESARIAGQARRGIDQDRLVDFLARKTYQREDPTRAAQAIQFTEPRYSCLTCRDTGIVPVWSGQVIGRLLAGKPIEQLRTETVACTCDRGEGLRSGRWEGSPTFDDVQFCQVIAPGWSCLDGLVRWLEGKGQMVPAPVPGGRFADEAQRAF
jgi:hypothetical protein